MAKPTSNLSALDGFHWHGLGVPVVRLGETNEIGCAAEDAELICEDDGGVGVVAIAAIKVDPWLALQTARKRPHTRGMNMQCAQLSEPRHEHVE